MKFRNLIIKNISRNKSRSFLAIIGIAIGVAAVVGLGLVTDGLSASTQEALTAGAADFSVVSGTTEGTGGPEGGGSPGGPGGQQLFNQTKVGEIQQISGVANATGVLRTNVDMNDSTSSSNTTSGSTGGMGQGNFRMMYSMIGIDSNYLSMEDIVITNGTKYSDGNEVIIGERAASSLNKTIGDTISLSNQTFKIVGIYETGNFQDDSGIVMSLSKLQNLTGNSGQISLILVKAKDNTDSSDLTDTIEQKYSDELTTSTSLSGMDRMQQGLETISSGAWAVSLLAVLIGGIVVVVTMMKAVNERTREIGVLRAIGWTKQRILLMIIGESAVLSIIAVLVGLAIGIGIVEIINSMQILRGISPTFSAFLMLKGVGVALFLGIVGGLYPAYRASRLSPTEALRYE